MLHNCHKRAKRYGRKVSITTADFEIPQICPLLGIPIFKNYGGKGSCPNSPTLDRLDPTKDYVPGNVWVISHKANTMKGRFSPTDLRRWADLIEAEIKRTEKAEGGGKPLGSPPPSGIY